MTVGFAAAAERVGSNPALYHLNSTAPDAPKVRPLEQEIARSLRGRAANPRWLAGQMRHGHRGAAEIAQSLDNLYAFAALTDLVRSAQFDLMFDATLGDDAVRAFLIEANRPAARHMAGVFEEAARRGFWLSRRACSDPGAEWQVTQREWSADATAVGHLLIATARSARRSGAVVVVLSEYIEQGKPIRAVWPSSRYLSRKVRPPFSGCSSARAACCLRCSGRP